MNSRYNVKKTKKTSDLKQALILIGIFLLLVLGVIFFISNSGLNIGSSTRMVYIPPVETYVLSSTGGLNRFNARVTLELDTDTPGISQEELFSYVYSAIANMSYEELSGPNGMNLIRENVHANISQYFDEGELVGIWLTDVSAHMPMPRQRGRRFTGFFPNID